MKLVTVFFDLEGKWGAPCYNYKQIEIESIVNNILKVLRNFKVSAVFNVCGKLAEEYPQLIKHISNESHEIASHGYVHEDFLNMSVNEMENALKKAELAVANATGKRPIGIRFPCCNYNKKIYSVVESRGYKWASNKHIFRKEQLYPPYLKNLKIKKLRALATKTKCSLRWFFYKKEPYKIGKLLEIPQLSTNDCGLFGLSDVETDSTSSEVEFGINVIKKQFEYSGRYFNLNFHPWVIGTGNRTKVLEEILTYLTRTNVRYILPVQLLEQI